MPEDSSSPAGLGPNLDGAKISKSRSTSCERCKRRKQKCDHRLPQCTNCLKAGAQCVQPEKYSRNTPAKDDYTAMLEAKISRLQEQLQSFQKSGDSKSNLQDPSPASISYGGPSPISGATPTSNASPVTSISLVTQAEPTRPTAVSILNVDPENATAAPPQSFTVVSSLLQETFWGRNKPDPELSSASSDHLVDGEADGLLPEYDFSEYLKVKPENPPNNEIGTPLIDGFLSSNHGRFPYIDRNALRIAHRDRFTQVNLDSPDYRYSNFILFTVYALGTVAHSRGQGESLGYEPFGFYSTALRHAKKCKSSDPIKRITVLILCAMFQMRTDKDHGCHYDMVRKAMQQCVEINLHKGEGLSQLPEYEEQFCKRLFWSVYSMERLFAISTGRPFVINEQDIDIEFPLDMDDEDLLEESKIAQLKALDIGMRPVSSLTFILHMWKLRRLESDLVQAIYRVDVSIEERFSRVNYYLDALKGWKASSRLRAQKEQNIIAMAYSRDIRLLLQPFLGYLSPDSELFQMCVRETGLICRVFKDFYRKVESGFTTMAMHTTFVAGLTLVYCLWLAKDASILPIVESIRSCMSVLYVLTERSNLCANYRDTLENLVTTTMKHLIEHKSMRRRQRELHEKELEQQIKEQQLKEKELIEERDLHNRQSHAPVSMNMPQESDAPIFDQVRSKASPQMFTIVRGANYGTPTVGNVAGAAPEQVEPASVSDFRTVVPGEPTTVAPAVSAAVTAPLPAATAPQKDWIESYGYDDTMYNMIQDISSWTRQVDDSNQQKVATEGVDDSNAWLPDNMWLNITDFSYS